MVCPYCSKSMIKGNIYSNRLYLNWIKGDKIPNAFTKIFNKETQKILYSDMFGIPHVETFYCEECKKMIIDLDNIL